MSYKMTAKEKQEAKAKAHEWLLANVPQGSTVYTVLTNVSRSGMSRSIKCLVTVGTFKDDSARDAILDIGWHVSHFLGLPLDKANDWSVKIGGCGMDMGFHLVSSLAETLGYNANEKKFVSGIPDGKTNAYGLNHKWL